MRHRWLALAFTALVSCSRQRDPHSDAVPSGLLSALASAPPSSEPSAASTQNTPPIVTIGQWKRDQVTPGPFVRHRNMVVVHAGRPLRVDPRKRTVKPWTSGACSEIERFTTNAIVCGGSPRHLLWHGPTGYERLELPASVHDDDAQFSVTSDASNVAVLEPTRIHVRHRRKTEWESHDIGPAPKSPGTMGVPNHLLIHEDVVLVGYDRGEWGGGLFAIDLQKPAWKQIDVGSEAPSNVRRIVPHSDGGAWVAFGMAHLSLREGAVARRLANEWQVIVSNRSDFPWPKAAFSSIAFDAAGVLHILSGAKGIIRKGDTEYTQLTIGWKDHVYVRDLMFAGHMAIIATYDAGIGFFDRNTRALTRVEIGKR